MKPSERKIPTELFYCPDCDRYLELPVSFGRKRCPKCSNKHSHDVLNKTNRERYAAMSEEEKAALLKYKRDKKATSIRPAKTQEDLEFERRYNIQRKQCEKCLHWTNDGANVEKFCHYYLRHGVGHRRDKGNGPGDCRSFEPRRKRTKQERLAHGKERLALTEVELYAQKPRKEEQENATR